MDELTVGLVGRGSAAEELARAVSVRPGLRFAGQSAPGAPLPQAELLLSAGLDTTERAALAVAAAGAGQRVVVSPLASVDEQVREALESGLVTQVSPLLGLGPLRGLADRMRRGEVGRRYGVFAQLQRRRDAAVTLDEMFAALLHYVLSTLDGAVVVAYACRSALCGPRDDAYHAVLRMEDETLVTLEAAAVLPESWPEDERVVVEATGSDAVVRAEPTRQAILVSARDGSTRAVPWVPNRTVGYLDAVLDDWGRPDPARELRYLDVLAACQSVAPGGGVAVP